MAARKKARTSTRKTVKAKKKTTARKTATRKTTRKTTKKTTAKRTTKKRTASRKAVQVRKITAIKKKPLSKSEITVNIVDSLLAADMDISKKEVNAVLEEFTHIIACSIGKNACGEFNWAGVLKIKKVRKPATKARPGVNPFTGEKIMIKAKPARNIVKVRALKKLKEMAA